jgi:hypothetical protein
LQTLVDSWCSICDIIQCCIRLVLQSKQITCFHENCSTTLTKFEKDLLSGNNLLSNLVCQFLVHRSFGGEWLVLLKTLVGGFLLFLQLSALLLGCSFSWSLLSHACNRQRPFKDPLSLSLSLSLALSGFVEVSWSGFFLKTSRQ